MQKQGSASACRAVSVVVDRPLRLALVALWVSGATIAAVTAWELTHRISYIQVAKLRAGRQPDGR
jgi:hypothetical protein